MTRIGATTPELMRRVVAATYRIEKQSSLHDANDPIRAIGRINVRNVSAFTIPEFGLMQIKSSTNQDKHTIIDVERPFSQSLPSSIFLINGPFEILASELGTAQTGPIFSVKKDSGTYVEGTRLGWTSDSFEASRGCLFTVIGVDDIAANILRVMTDFSVLHGVVTTQIAANLGTAGNVLTSDPTTTHKAKTRKGAIAVDDEVYIWPSKGEWIAAKVC